MKVPLLDLRPPLEDLRDEIVEAITQVIDSTRYIMGPEIDNLEKEIAEYCGTADAVGVSSGTDALLLSLMVLDVGPGDLVLTSNFSFFATAGVVARLNATPVFVDIDPETYNIDPECVRMTLAEMDKETRKRVKAIIPVHLYGQCADMKAILNIAAEFEKISDKLTLSRSGVAEISEQIEGISEYETLIFTNYFDHIIFKNIIYKKSTIC